MLERIISRKSARVVITIPHSKSNFFRDPLTEFSKHSMRSQENIVSPRFFISYSVRGLDRASEIN
jgi:hypothetical protein